MIAGDPGGAAGFGGTGAYQSSGPASHSGRVVLIRCCVGNGSGPKAVQLLRDELRSKLKTVTPAEKLNRGAQISLDPAVSRKSLFAWLSSKRCSLDWRGSPPSLVCTLVQRV
jgi:hypothetical protein